MWQVVWYDYQLERSSYGLKQASRQCYRHLSKYLVSLGFVQCLADACVFRSMGHGGRVVIIIITHVDGMFAFGEGDM